VTDDDRIPVAALDRISDAIFAVDDAFRFTYVNEQALRLLDTDREPLLGTPLWDSVPDIAGSTVQTTIEDAMETGKPQSIEWHVEEWDQWLHIHIYPDDSGLSILCSEITEQKRREQNLSRLHEATREMLAAHTPTEVAAVMCRTAVEILGLPISGVHFYDEAADALVPVAQSEESREIIGEAPALDAGLAWESYNSGEARVANDLRTEDDVYDRATAFRSELFVPLDEFGVFIVAATRPDAFTDMEITFAKLLGANATEALARVHNERRLEKQRDNLDLLTQMMSHDIRNDLQVVAAAADTLAERVDSDESELVEKINRATVEAVELTTSARELTQAMLRTETGPKPVSIDEPLRAQIEELRATTELSITVADPLPTVSVMAGEMLDSVFRNILKNAVEHNDSETPEVTVTVETGPETVVVRIADNGPGVPDESKEEIFGRGQKGMSSHGTGIGLYLVRTLTDQYGGRAWVEDNDPSGAVFIIELSRAEAEPAVS